MGPFAGMSSWQRVLEQCRATCRSPRGPYDLRLWWRAQAYREHAEEAETLVRAHAFARVLDRVPLVLYEGEAFAGSRAGFCAADLPAGISERAYREAAAACTERGQRDFLAGFDHSLADYPTLLRIGIGGIIQRAEQSLRRRAAAREVAFLGSVLVALRALSRFALRYAALCRERDREDVAACLEAVALAPPRTLRQAMQLVWLVHVAFVSEGRAHMALGRIDQVLLPFYERDLAAGRLTREGALELFCHLWAKVAELGEVTNICIGGLTPDGGDATNELSYLCLEATRRVQSPHTNLSARFHDATPERFHRACFECIRTGVGFPAIFNDHVLIPGLEEIGIPAQVARDHCMVGCIETMLAGRQPPWSDSRYNTPLFLTRALERLRQEPEQSYERLMALFEDEMRRGMTAYVARINSHIARFPVERFPDPFLSALTRDCIGRARDVNDGGAEFERFHGVAVMGLATVADSLAAVRKLVFEQRAVAYDELTAALDADFEGREPLRLMLLNRAPKYGNGDPYVDDIAAWLVGWTADECLRHRVHGGGRFVSAMAANVSNIPAGKEVGATPDGRKAHTPLSDAASPHFGRDRHGPTAFLESVARPDYHRVLTGSVVNMKFEPELFQDEAGAERFAALTHAFVDRRIQELQFNFTGNRVLRDAQANPQDYPNLVVRVSGFSAYFTRLDREVQNDVIRRRAHP